MIKKTWVIISPISSVGSINMAKKTNGHKTKMPKVTKISQEQMDEFLAEIMASNISEKSAEFAKMLIQGNAWMARQLELGQLSIAKLRKLFQIQGSEKGSNRKPNMIQPHPIIKALTLQKIQKGMVAIALMRIKVRLLLKLTILN